MDGGRAVVLAASALRYPFPKTPPLRKQALRCQFAFVSPQRDFHGALTED
jgi:hypothetical protein